MRPRVRVCVCLFARLIGEAGSADAHVSHTHFTTSARSQTTFKGKVYMTHPTKALFRWTLDDYIRVRYDCPIPAAGCIHLTS